MGLISETVMIRFHGNNIEHYNSKGYEYKKGDVGKEFECRVEDLPKGSHAKVKVICDGCGEILKDIQYKTFINHKKENDLYYCSKCSSYLLSSDSIKKYRLKNSISFEQWCYDNLLKEEVNEILARWDYEKNIDKKGNIINPNEICYSSSGLNRKGYWFKCIEHPEHESELKNISDFTNGCKGSIKCNKCNSFAQYLIDTYGENTLELYWDYDKNIINPWKISWGSNKKIYVYCQEVKYHGSYETTCVNFINSKKCPYCYNTRIHPLDSLGQYIVDNYGEKFLNSIWSDKNKKSAFTLKPISGKKAWFKCADGKHDDFERKISVANRYDFRCPECGFSKGEQKISDWFIENNIKYDNQVQFDNLIGLGGGNLSYDFYVSHLNLLIEYQGEFHDGSSGEYSKINLKTQKEHDRRKKQYCIDNNINLLEIWYWDFDNVETILKDIIINKNCNNEHITVNYLKNPETT